MFHDGRAGSGLCIEGSEDVDPGGVDDGDVGLELAGLLLYVLAAS